MSVNLSNQQNVEQIVAAVMGQIQETETQTEYNRLLSKFHDDMNKFEHQNPVDAYHAKTESRKRKEKNFEPNAIAKAVDWVAKSLGLDLEAEEESMIYDLGQNRLLKEHQLTMEALAC